MRQSLVRVPFSRLLDVDTVPDSGLEFAVEAGFEECATISEALKLPAVGALAATFRIARRPGGRFKVEGEVEARITQICVVTLDRFESDVVEPIDVTFAPAASPDRRPEAPKGGSRRSCRNEPADAPVIARAEEGEDDPPDPIIDGRIDLGAVAVEFLTLALDFYPRKPGVRFSDVVTGEPGPNSSAFSALERFKDRS